MIKKYYVIGNPIDHSLSPKLHNFWFEQNNIRATYEKKKINNNKLQSIISEIKEKKINGINVTVPFKKAVIPYLDKLSSEAEQTQSVNTIILHNNDLIGHNTDITGFTKAIENLNFEIEGKKVLILGAGGVVPSIIFALRSMEASNIIISNRTREKAESLKNQFKDLEVIDWGNMCNFDVIINATSIGIKDEVLTLDFSKVGSNKLFYDVIYNPSETQFLKTGKKLGNQVENGKMMFIYQALESFKLWHRITPEVNKGTFAILEND